MNKSLQFLPEPTCAFAFYNRKWIRLPQFNYSQHEKGVSSVYFKLPWACIEKMVYNCSLVSSHGFVHLFAIFLLLKNSVYFVPLYIKAFSFLLSLLPSYTHAVDRDYLNFSQFFRIILWFIPKILIPAQSESCESFIVWYQGYSLWQKLVSLNFVCPTCFFISFQK